MLGISAKARLVEQGCRERNSIRSDSPRASLRAFRILCSYPASMTRAIHEADASNAYLQAGGIGHMLALKLPKPLLPGVLRGELLRARWSIYGTRDAGRCFCLHLRGILYAAGLWESAFEPALFYQVYEGREVRCDEAIVATHGVPLPPTQPQSCAAFARLWSSSTLDWRS